jgi:hypothetical protein
MIKRVEVNYRGIFQKNLGKYIGSDIVMIATSMGKVAFSNGRYSDSPERNGIPCKYFAFVSPDLAEEELEAECGAKLDIDEADVSVVLDDTMVKGVEPWGWHGVRSINEKVREKGCLLVVTRHKTPDLLQFIGKLPHPYRLATLEGDASLAGLWVFKDDLTRERVLGAIAAVDPGIIAIEAVEAYLGRTARRGHRLAARNSGPAQVARVPGHGRRRARRQTELRNRSARTGPKRHVQARHDEDPPADRPVRSLHQVHTLLAGLPRRLLRSDGRRVVRRELRGLRRLPQVRGRLPGARVHRHGGRAQGHGQRQPVGTVQEGSGRVHRVGRGDEGHRARTLPARHGHGPGDSGRQARADEGGEEVRQV